MSRSRADLIRIQEKEIAAIGLRREGATYDEIAVQLGYADHTGARSAVLRGMRRALQEPADELRELEAARLDALMRAHWPFALAGDSKAAVVVLRTMERRAKLLGLDAPMVASVDVTVFEGGSELDREVQRLAEILAADGHSGGGRFADDLEIEVGEA